MPSGPPLSCRAPRASACWTPGGRRCAAPLPPDSCTDAPPSPVSSFPPGRTQRLPFSRTFFVSSPSSIFPKKRGREGLGSLCGKLSEGVFLLEFGSPTSQGEALRFPPLKPTTRRPRLARRGPGAPDRQASAEPSPSASFPTVPPLVRSSALLSRVLCASRSVSSGRASRLAAQRSGVCALICYVYIYLEAKCTYE